MTWVDVLKVSLSLTAIVIGIAFVYFCIMGLVIYLNGQVAPDWWPEWIAKIFQNIPKDTTKKYKYLSNVYSAGSNVLSTYTNHTQEQCLEECGEADDCIGVMTQPSSNTCSTLKSVMYPIPFTGNNFFVVEGMEPTKVYSSYTSNTVDTYTTTTIPSIVVSSYFDCASNCSSNASCTGFVYNSNTNTCQTYNNIKTSNLSTTTASFTSYVLSAASYLASPY
jgi:hypothetical protein